LFKPKAVIASPYVDNAGLVNSESTTMLLEVNVEHYTLGCDGWKLSLDGNWADEG
jgi:hypothetical protein